MVTKPPLWLCLHLPQLSLDLYKRSQYDAAQPLVISQGLGPQQHILAANSAARQFGIHNGMKLSAAHSLCDTLVCCVHNHDIQQQELQSLALWCMQYTSIVSLCPPQSLLLEIRGSLHLFAGLSPLLTQIKQGIEALGYQLTTAVSPTPLGAQIFAAHEQQHALDSTQLRNQLMPLPLSHLKLPTKAVDKLRKLGLKNCRDILRLPRDQLQQRYGISFCQHLQKLLGDLPDPRPSFVAAENFRRKIELPAQVNNTQALIFVGQRLLQELHGFLTSRCAATQSLHWQLCHPHQPATRFSLTLVSPCNDIEHLHRLLRERLERLSLNGDVINISLNVDDIQQQENHSQALFPSQADHASASWQGLVEKLIARLGEDNVSGLAAQSDHRPEYSQKNSQIDQQPAVVISNKKRPVWLLKQPKSLEVRRQQLWHQGPLEIISAAERIESGWWDGQDIRRDYFLAQNPQGQQLWIFREKHSNERWYLHGFFH